MSLQQIHNLISNDFTPKDLSRIPEQARAGAVEKNKKQIIALLMGVSPDAH